MSQRDAPDSKPDAQAPAPAKRGGGELSASRRRLATTALAGYAVVAIFGAAYGIVRLGWPQASASQALIVGALVAGPAALALTWERLTGLKLFGVEVTLSNCIIPIDQRLSTALSASQFFSDKTEIFQVVDRVVENPSIDLLEINLRARMPGKTDYWWSTRLYLQAALVDDHTRIQGIVFVEGDTQRRYVGIASPGAVRRALARPPGLNLELAYRQIDLKIRTTPAVPGKSDVQRVVEDWAIHEFRKNGTLVNEEAAKTTVSAELLTQAVTLERGSVEWDQPLDSALLQALVLDKGTRFVPLTKQGQLKDVVNADDFARGTAAQTLRAKLR